MDYFYLPWILNPEFLPPCVDIVLLQAAGSGVDVGTVSNVCSGADRWTEEPLPGAERAELQHAGSWETTTGQKDNS